MKRKILSLVLTLTLCIGMMPMAATALATNTTEAPYIDANGTQKIHPNANVVAENTTELNEGWYVVNSKLTLTDNIVVSENAHLILADGAEIEFKHTNSLDSGIVVNEGNSLTIYGQSEGTGKLKITRTGTWAAIGGKVLEDCGDITINGGHVTAHSVEGSGIGGGNGHDKKPGDGGNVIVNGGTVIAIGGAAPAIGGGASNSNHGTLTLNNGETVTVASRNHDGTSPEEYSDENRKYYHYMKIEPLHTITFKYNDGVTADTTQKTNSLGNLTSLPTPKRTDYTFKGWYTEETGGAEVTTSTKFETDSIVYAHWTEYDYKGNMVKPDNNGDATSPINGDTSEVVETGDENNVGLYIVLMVFAGAVVFAITKRKGRN